MPAPAALADNGQLVDRDRLVDGGLTEGPGGGFPDNGSAFGVFSRLDLYRAAERAIAMAPATVSLH